MLLKQMMIGSLQLAEDVHSSVLQVEDDWPEPCS